MSKFVDKYENSENQQYYQKITEKAKHISLQSSYSVIHVQLDFKYVTAHKPCFPVTVYDTVMLGRYPHLKNVWWESGEDETFVVESLKKFGVWHLRDRPLHMLSSGERQRVLIAKAYVQEPRLMLVDEPTSHLDMKYKLDVMEYLNAMVKKDMTILVAEHDISLMARYCDLCIIMKKGEIVAIGKPKDVITPELIEDVYEVSASVGFDHEGELYVLPKRYRAEGERDRFEKD